MSFPPAPLGLPLPPAAYVDADGKRTHRSMSRGTLPEYRLGETSLDLGDRIRPLCVSDGRGWTDLHATLADECPHRTVHRAIPGTWLAMALEDTDLCRYLDGQKMHQRLGPYQTTITAPANRVEDVIGNTTRALHVFLKPELVDEVAGELFDAAQGSARILSSYGVTDPALNLLMRAIQCSLLDASDTRIEVEYLSRALAAQVLRKHSVQHRHTRPPRRGGLSSAQVRRVSEYVHEHLGSEILLGDLAAVANLSRTPFIQRFKVSMQVTPHQYLTRERVERAKDYLARPYEPIAHIAAACGFSDQAHFSSVFKRLVGVPPSVYRREMA